MLDWAGIYLGEDETFRIHQSIIVRKKKFATIYNKIIFLFQKYKLNILF